MSLEDPRLIKGTFKELILSPKRLSIAGNKVKEAATLTTTTTIAPPPRLRRTENGVINIPIKAKTTVIPENTTALLAVPPVFEIASAWLNPLFLSSRYLETTKRE